MPIYGTPGDDNLFGTSNGESIYAGAGNDIVHAGDGHDGVYGEAGNDTLYGDGGNDWMEGGDGSDILEGGDGNDVLRGLVGADQLYGGAGDDNLTIDADDTVVRGGIGFDQVTVLGATGVILDLGIAEVEKAFGDTGNDTFYTTGSGRIEISGQGGNDILLGGDGDDYLSGGPGADRLEGGAGNDTLYMDANDTLVRGGSGSDTLYASSVVGQQIDAAVLEVETVFGSNLMTSGSGDVRFFGQNTNDSLTGGSGNDYIDGGAGNDVIRGGAGADTMIGGAGDDWIMASAEDVSIQGGLGRDTVEVEGSNGITLHLVSSSIESVYGGSGNDVLNGTGGTIFDNFSLRGEGGDDVLIGGITYDLLEGGDGNDLLDGGLGGDDYLRGGAGDDVYVVNSAGDSVNEIINEGSDRVEASVSYVLAANAENLTLTGNGTINGTGNILGNTLVGNSAANVLSGGDGDDVIHGGDGDDMLDGGSGNDQLFGEGGNDNLVGGAGDDLLDGGAGSDTMAGGTGNDTYVVDTYGDVVVEVAGEGIDTIQSSTISVTLNQNVENATLIGGSSLSASGNALDNMLVGNSGSNFLDGGLGNDMMIGGAGNDQYNVDSSGDIVVESAGEGTDQVFSTVSYALAPNIENIMLMESDSINAIGNELANGMWGNDGANVLDGGLGADAMFGGLGDDTYIVETLGDMVFESPGGGIDTLVSGIDNFIPFEVEHLTLTGAALVGSGNSGDNVLTGNGLDNILAGGFGNDTLIGGAGNDQLDGEWGADAMAGGTGNDTYVVDDANDEVTESAGEGIDTVEAGVDYTLGANVENLTLGFSINGPALSGTGNALGNVLIGNFANNILSGGDGDDTLRGGDGNDTLDGGNGNDQLFGEGGDDALLGGEGFDQLYGGAGQDILLGGDGIDHLHVDANDAVIDGGAGFDYLFAEGTIGVTVDLGAASIDQAYGNAGNDTFFTSGPTAVTILGYGGNDSLSGGAGTDFLYGGAGADSFWGGEGYDQLYVDRDDVVIDGGGGLDQVFVDDTSGFALDLGQGHIEYAYGNIGNDVFWTTGTDSVTLTGFGGDDILTGGIGNDTLVGDNPLFWPAESGNDVLDGGAGDDQLSGGLGNDILRGGTGNDVLFGEDDFNPFAPLGNDFLDGGQGADQMYGGMGDDAYVVDDVADVVSEYYFGLVGNGVDTVQSSISYSLVADVENLILTGTNGVSGNGNWLNNIITGNSGNNILFGGYGDDVLDGGTGNDTMNGEGGNDTLTDSQGGSDIYQWGVGGGQDQVIDYELIQGSTDAVQLLGVTSADLSIARYLNISPNAITLQLVGSNDTLTLQNWFDPNSRIEEIRFSNGTVWNQSDVMARIEVVLNGTEGDDYLYGTPQTETINGLGGNDFLFAQEGNDVLNGGIGVDDMWGGAGDDRYIVENTFDRIIENVDQGNDFVESSVSYTLPDQVENLTLTGTNTTGIGNHLDNVMQGTSTDDILVGNGGNDTMYGEEGTDILEGNEGNDYMVGGTGDDVYFVQQAGDVVVELQGEGLDSAYSYLVSYTLGSHIEQLFMYGAAEEGIGNDLDNYMLANGASNRLDGGAGADIMNGGYGGNDTYIVDNVNDVVIEYWGGNDMIQSSVSYTLSENVEALMLTGNMAIAGNGNGLDNTLYGNSAANVLAGAAGNDAYVVGFGDIVIENAGEGTDTVLSDVSFTLGAHTERLVLAGTATIHGTGNELDNTLFGNGAANILDGGVGADVMAAGQGNDTYIVDNTGDVVTEQASEGTDSVLSAISYQLSANVENLTLTGMAAINGTGNALDNVIAGNGSDNLLDGRQGNDVLQGGAGHDVYRFNVGDGVDTIQDVSTIGEGNRLEFGVGITQSDLTVTRDVIARTLTIDVGLTGTDQIVLTNFDSSGTNGSLVVETLAFSDGTTVDFRAFLNQAPTVVVPLADQTAVEDALFSYTVPATTFADVDAGDALTYSATLADGTALPTWLSFDAATRTFSGTPGNAQVGSLEVRVTATDTGNLSVSDTLTLTVQNVNDAPTVATPLADQLAVEDAAFTYTVPATTFADVDAGDALTYSASLADGTALPTWLSFDAATRTFTGTPHASDAGVLSVKVTATDSGSLSAFDLFDVAVTIPNLTLTGTAGSDTLTGGSGNDQLFGLAGNDTLNGRVGNDLLEGGVGSDSMVGGQGDDTYLVDNVGDTVTEAANEGSDTVQASITYTLAANVENLTLTGTAAINGTGNTLDNVLTGNSAANTLTGGAGNDTYIVGTGDTVVEAANSGTDTVQSALTYTLGSNVENLTLIGSAAINGTGNSLANVLTGNSAANTLTGGAGNDTYVVGAGDTVVESNNNGTDTVHSSVTWTLGSNLESLTLVGTAAINGTGNSANNVLTGNSANNVLSASGGSDTLRGGLGNDTVNGGSGSDTYLFGRGEGQDLVQDSGGSADRAIYDAGINPLDLVISRQANDLRLAIHGSTDYVTVQSWYTSSSNRVETIQAGNGQVLLSTQVDQLIQAMASFTQQTGLTWDAAAGGAGTAAQQAQFQGILAANWQ